MSNQWVTGPFSTLFPNQNAINQWLVGCRERYKPLCGENNITLAGVVAQCEAELQTPVPPNIYKWLNSYFSSMYMQPNYRALGHVPAAVLMATAPVACSLDNLETANETRLLKIKKLLGRWQIDREEDTQRLRPLICRDVATPEALVELTSQIGQLLADLSLTNVSPALFYAYSTLVFNEAQAFEAARARRGVFWIQRIDPAALDSVENKLLLLSSLMASADKQELIPLAVENLRSELGKLKPQVSKRQVTGLAIGAVGGGLLVFVFRRSASRLLPKVGEEAVKDVVRGAVRSAPAQVASLLMFLLPQEK